MGPLSILQPHVAASLLDLVGEFAFVYRGAADGSTHLEWSNIPFTEWTGRTEAMGLAVMTELPLVIVTIQRGGPSTGLPTKTEQSDLYQAVYGRNGDI